MSLTLPSLTSEFVPRAARYRVVSRKSGYRAASCVANLPLIAFEPCGGSHVAALVLGGSVLGIVSQIFYVEVYSALPVAFPPLVEVLDTIPAPVDSHPLFHRVCGYLAHVEWIARWFLVAGDPESDPGRLDLIAYNEARCSGTHTLAFLSLSWPRKASTGMVPASAAEFPIALGAPLAVL